MEALHKLQKFFSYWYLRYLLATELYIVEPWEKAVIRLVLNCFLTMKAMAISGSQDRIICDMGASIPLFGEADCAMKQFFGLVLYGLPNVTDIFLAIFFGLFWYFNSSIVLSGIQHMWLSTPIINQALES